MIPSVASNSYLTFLMGNDKFAVHVAHVQEVIEVGQIIKLPHAPACMLGIINLRGKILPLIDTRQRLGLPSIALTASNRTLVLDIKDTADKQLLIGATVDIASEVVSIGAQDIQDPEHIHFNNTTPLSGIVNQEGEITMILNVSTLFPIRK